MTHRHQSVVRDHNGFTLVELLMVIAIIGLLAATVLFAMAGAVETAREQSTRTQIRKINSFISDIWEDFESIRVRINGTQLETRAKGLEPPSPDSRLNRVAGVRRSRLMAQYRVDMMRELMRMTLPDRKSDLRFTTLNSGYLNHGEIPEFYFPQESTHPPFDQNTYAGVLQVPLLMSAYRAKAAQMLISHHRLERRRATWSEEFRRNDVLEKWQRAFDDSECLYLILSQIVEDGRSALEFFSENELTDIDNDGMPEISDAWGNPINFMRWAPGFTKITTEDVAQYEELNPGRSDIGKFRLYPNAQRGSMGTLQSIRISDPHDVLGLYANNPLGVRRPTTGQVHVTFALYPLVMSAGPDQIADIRTRPGPNQTPGAVFETRDITQNSPPPNNPFAWSFAYDTVNAAFLDYSVGSWRDDGNGKDNSADNIHNHSLASGG